MKRIIIGVLLLVVLGALSSCVFPGKATVIFSNKTTSYYLRFTLDGAQASPSPIAPGRTTQWAALSPGSRTLGATACDSSGTSLGLPQFSETVNLPADLITTWSVTDSDF